MTAWFALLRRELGVYFVSPMAYIILTALLLVSGLAFVSSVERFASDKLPADYVPTLFFIVWIIVTASPLVTMRLIAEEKSRGTIEILMTAPVSEPQVVLAKFSAAVTFLLYLLLPTLVYPVILSLYGQVDLGAVACGYAGVVLVGAVVFSIGLFISSLCTSQVTAGIVSLMVSLLLIFASFLAGGLFRNEAWADLLEFVNLSANVMDFLKGVVDTRRLTYLAGVMAFFLFLTVCVVESRRWR